MEGKRAGQGAGALQLHPREGYRLQQGAAKGGSCKGGSREAKGGCTARHRPPGEDSQGCFPEGPAQVAAPAIQLAITVYTGALLVAAPGWCTSRRGDTLHSLQELLHPTQAPPQRPWDHYCCCCTPARANHCFSA
jgi:hypothetical protein